jgi:hypothetical protein
MLDAQLITQMETTVNDLLNAFDVTTPPVPVELMLQRPKAGMWKEVNLTEMTGQFIDLRRHKPRTSVARLLARYILRSEWGNVRGIGGWQGQEEITKAFARAILMPRDLLLAQSVREVASLSVKFEMHEEDVQLRLADLGM